ncbi:hypothetical protein MYCTH_2119852 [Thermothelomyces thermophilus ATCC 42464]|uniref:Uncharacterized protein n=1 Tax=Thermothelomyces thermophilus (strain ATCC 42464 / BCRC 31852 / DSM 1799) TaxID=573729 RepID=G2QJG0_THET4|nr:uncharacterized protein MYCTH_2119852 [Thermothelomyces thermophilus ATCC 42464]AEO59717.1 hypothetical protein MYCTH_2119852 [Thermothelomyces thermophilus ATCC 42464]
MSGKNLVLSAATKTTNWKRPDLAVHAMKAPLEEAVAANESILPRNTAEVILRTAVCVDSSGNFIRTVHLPTGK